jgi:hypothetical protein
MLTGVPSRAEAEAAPGDRHPTAIAADATELAEVLDRLAR